MSDSEKRKNGEGSFYATKSGRIRMVVQRNDIQNKNGNPLRITVTGTSKTDCVRKMHAKMRDIDDYGNSYRGTGLDEMTLVELCMHHLQWDISLRYKLKSSAIDRRELTILKQIGDYPIGTLPASSVTPNDIRHHIRDLLSTPSRRSKTGVLSVSTVEKAYNVINGAYKWAKTAYHLRYNPCESIHDELTELFKTLKDRKEPEECVITLSEDDINAITEETKRTKYKQITNELFDLAVLFLINTGMRVGELCALRWRDYVSKIGVLRITKTRKRVKDRSNSVNKTKVIEESTKNDKTRNILLTEEAVALLEKMKTISVEIKKRKGTELKEDDYIIVNRNNKPTCPSDFDFRLKRFFSSAGLDTTQISGAHVFRRTSATGMHRDGGSTEEIAAYIGDSPGTVQKYYISNTKSMESNGKKYDVVPLPAIRKTQEEQS